MRLSPAGRLLLGGARRLSQDTVSCKQKENEPKGQSKRLSAFPTLPARSQRPPSPQVPGEGLWSFPSLLSLIFGIAEPAALFSRRRGGWEEARGEDGKVTSAVLVSHTSFCAKSGGLGGCFL